MVLFMIGTYNLSDDVCRATRTMTCNNNIVEEKFISKLTV
jgi:hypothetical protein